MTRLYLDIECYCPPEKKLVQDSQIIAAGMFIDRTPPTLDSLDQKMTPYIYANWNGHDEYNIVKKIKQTIDMLLKEKYVLKLYGFSILNFDLPVIISRIIKYTKNDIKSEQAYWHDLMVIDLHQQVLLMNNSAFTNSGIGPVLNYCLKMGLEPPTYTELGSTIHSLYQNKQYKEIENHLINDLNATRWLHIYGIPKLLDFYMKKDKEPLFLEN